MYKLNRSSLKEVGLVGTIFGTLLVGFSAITQSAVASKVLWSFDNIRFS